MPQTSRTPLLHEKLDEFLRDPVGSSVSESLSFSVDTCIWMSVNWGVAEVTRRLDAHLELVLREDKAKP